MSIKQLIIILIIINIIQIPLTQSLSKRLYEYLKYKEKKLFRFVKKWSRRFYYWVKGLFR